MAFAGALIRDRHLEAKSVGIEVVARYRRDFTPRLLPAWKAGWPGTIRPTGRPPTRSAACPDRSAAAAASRARRAHARLGARSQHVGAPGVDRRVDPPRAPRRVARSGLRDRASPARRSRRSDSEGRRVGAARGGQDRHAAARAVSARQRRRRSRGRRCAMRSNGFRPGVARY